MELDKDIQELLDERARTMVDFTADHRPFNMYAIYRADLEMPPGKMAAQCGHAFQGALAAARKLEPSIDSLYTGTGEGTKIILYARNLGQLLRAYRECTAAEFPCHLVIDRRHLLPPHFDGKPIITALGIGPVYRDQLQHIAKRYTHAH